MIITKSISRFARNTLDCLNYVRSLKALPSPVGVYFEKENIDTLDAKGELLLTILSSLAQDESRSISENVCWSNQKRYQQGLAHCPTAFFLGYDTDEDGNMIINEEQAKTVRRIYRECLEGYSSKVIANRLTADGEKTGKGKTSWLRNGVQRILRNEKYCGDILMQKRVTLDYLTHKRTPNRGHQPQYFIADHHPGIISHEEWNAVQIELEHRIEMRYAIKEGMLQRPSNKTIFSNILFCGTCGDPFIRRTVTSTKKNLKYLYPTWKCRVADGRRKGRTCHARSYREEAMEHAFMVMLLMMKHHKYKLVEAAEIRIAEMGLDEWEKERWEFLKLEIESLNERLSSVAASAQKGSARDVYDGFSMNLTDDLQVLRSEWDQLDHKKNEAFTLKQTLNWLLEELKDFNYASDCVEFRENIFQRIVKRGDVSDDGSIIYELIFGITRTATNNGNPREVDTFDTWDR